MSVDTTVSVDTTMADASTADTSMVDVSTTDAATDAVPDQDAGTEQDQQTELDTRNQETKLDTGTEVTFESLDLPAPLLSVLNEAGVVTAFPIQAATIPDALIGRDVLGRGRTGSGKTLAFGLPTLTRLEGLRAKPRRPLALVLVPTRELAMQVEDALRPYARALRLRIRSVYGGAPMRKQIDNLRYGVEILVATPGRLSDLIERGECELGEVDVAILDEADQMCDMGFLPHVCELMDQVAAGGQRLLFSATLDGAVDEIVKKYMNDPVLHEVDPQAGVVSTMSHHLLMVTPQHKAKVAVQIAGRHAAEAGNASARSIFFVRTQMAVDRVTEQFREHGLPAAGLHGGMTQVARTKTLEDFKEGRTPVLIATDVAARGIHVDGIDLVVHLDPARDSKDYLHRAGRTARAGQTGVVASLVLPKQRKLTQRMMDDAGVTANELDAAPLGVGGRWESAGTALADLTGAREVPEPGDVTPFTLPVRERISRAYERRDGGGRYERDDRGHNRRDDRRSGSFDGGRDGSRFSRDGNRDGSRFNGGRYDRDERRGQSFDRRDGDRYGRDRNRDGWRGGASSTAPGSAGPAQEQGQGQGFKASGSPERDLGSRDGSAGRGFGSRDSSAGRGFGGGQDSERRGFGRGSDSRRFDGRGFEGRGSESRGADGRGADGRGAENRGFEGRRADGRSADGRGFDGRGVGGRDFKGRDADNRGRFDRNDRSTGANRSGYGEYRDRPPRGDRFQHGESVPRTGGFPRNETPSRGERPWRDDRRGGDSRPRSDWNRDQQHTSRDNKPRA